MRPFVVELLDEIIELGLLLQDVGTSRPSGFLLQCQMHTFMPAMP
jgi:hypothetical protein